MTPFTLWSTVSGICAFLLLYLWGTYNSSIKKLNQVKTDYSDIDVQLKRKASLVDNLIALVREYAKHEKGTFTEVTKARSALDNSKTAGDSAKADNMLTQTLRSLFMVAENYPKLEASQNYRELRQDIKETEDLIATYREEYNRSVQSFNNHIQTFPNLVVSALLGFKAQELYQIAG